MEQKEYVSVSGKKIKVNGSHKFEVQCFATSNMNQRIDRHPCGCDCFYLSFSEEDHIVHARCTGCNEILYTYSQEQSARLLMVQRWSFIEECELAILPIFYELGKYTNLKFVQSKAFLDVILEYSMMIETFLLNDLKRDEASSNVNLKDIE